MARRNLRSKLSVRSSQRRDRTNKRAMGTEEKKKKKTLWLHEFQIGGENRKEGVGFSQLETNARQEELLSSIDKGGLLEIRLGGGKRGSSRFSNICPVQGEGRVCSAQRFWMAFIWAAQ